MSDNYTAADQELEAGDLEHVDSGHRTDLETSMVSDNLSGEMLISEDNLQDVLSPDLRVVGAIVAIALEEQSDPSQDVLSRLFLTTREFIRTQFTTANTGDISPIVFAYYLEAHRTASIYANKSKTNPVELDLMALYHSATLSVFDVYLKFPNNTTARKMVKLAAESFYKVSVAFHTVQTDIPTKEALSNLSTLALIAGTVKEYIKGKRRKENYQYITWLREFFVRTLKDPDLAFIKDDTVVKSVVDQLIKKRPSITIPSA